VRVALGRFVVGVWLFLFAVNLRAPHSVSRVDGLVVGIAPQTPRKLSLQQQVSFTPGTKELVAAMVNQGKGVQFIRVLCQEHHAVTFQRVIVVQLCSLRPI